MSDKRRLYKCLIAAMAVIGVLAIIVVCMIKYIPTSKQMSSEDYFGAIAEGEAVVIIEDHVAQEHALLVDGSAYIDYMLVQSELNDRFYWDASVGEILYTTSETTLEIPVNSTSYYADDKSFDVGYEIIKTSSSGMYLSANFLQMFTDLTHTVYEAPSRVVIRFGSRDRAVASVKNNAAIRYRGGIKSPIITKTDGNGYVYVLNQLEHWIEVCTEDGYIGYIKSKSLKKITTKTSETYYSEQTVPSMQLEEKLNLLWHQIDIPEANDYLKDDIASVTGVNVISPTWYSLSDNYGGVNSLAQKSYVKKAHKRGLQVWALVSNFSADISTTTILASKEARNRIQEYLVSQALELGFDGINVDLEAIAQEAGYSYVQFMRELSILCRKNQIYLSVDVPVPMDFNMYYNRAELGRVCDYVIIMGYDEHYYGSESAGSVASMQFEESGLIETLKAVPAHKVVSGIPFYSRVWYTEASENGENTVTSETISMNGAKKLLEELQIEAVYDEATGQNYAEWTDESGRLCQIWLEDEFSVGKRVELAQNYAVGGIAEWVLGCETNAVWKIIEEELSH